MKISFPSVKDQHPPLVLSSYPQVFQFKAFLTCMDTDGSVSHPGSWSDGPGNEFGGSSDYRSQFTHSSLFGGVEFCERSFFVSAEAY